MTVTREAYLLPAMFLTVTLLGGLRIAQTVRLVPPPLAALVLGLLLLAALMRAGVLVPAAFVHARRPPLANASGAVVLVTLSAASTQIFTLLTPDRGLFHVIFGTFFFVQLLTTLAGTEHRQPLLRSLLVLLGSAFVLRFIILESLYATTGGTLTRLLTVLLEGVSLGMLQYEPNAPATGYLAFVALATYLLGLYLLADQGDAARAMPLDSRAALRHPAERHELHRNLPALRGE